MLSATKTLRENKLNALICFFIFSYKNRIILKSLHYMSIFVSLKYGEFKNSPSVMPKLCATKKTVDNLTSFVLPFSIVWIVVLSKQVSFINLYCVLFFSNNKSFVLFATASAKFIHHTKFNHIYQPNSRWKHRNIQRF